MTLYRLPGGTDVAEMALFDVDSVPHDIPKDGEVIDELAPRKHLVRLPTGGDGGYLLHLYVNEAAPASVKQYCVADDSLSGKFSSPGGRIAFGGVESAFQRFKANKNIRSDATITPGEYAYKAYHTDIPDEVIETVLRRVPSTPTERWLDRAPMVIFLGTVGSIGVSLSSKSYLLAGVAAVVGPLVFKAVKRIPGQDVLSVRREQAQIDLPSIVIELIETVSADEAIPGAVG
jgi:hypothetical protein